MAGGLVVGAAAGSTVLAVAAAGATAVAAAARGDTAGDVARGAGRGVVGAVHGYQAADAKYHITEKVAGAARAAGGVASAGVAKAREMDQEHNISAKVGAAASAGVARARELNRSTRSPTTRPPRRARGGRPRSRASAQCGRGSESER